MPIDTRDNVARFTTRIAAVAGVALFGAAVALVAPASARAQGTAAPATGPVVINGQVQDYGPLAQLIGTWETVNPNGLDVAPGQAGTSVGAGGRAVSPFYEIITFKPSIPITNDSVENVVSLSYHEAVYRRTNHHWFHDQRGYLIYDKQTNTVYNTFCLPRTVCVVAEGKAGKNKMTLTATAAGIAQAPFMLANDKTLGFSITYDLSPDILHFTETTDLFVYGKPFSHVDSDTLHKIS